MNLPLSALPGGPVAGRLSLSSPLSQSDKKLAQRLRLLGAPFALREVARIIPGWQAPPRLRAVPDGANTELIYVHDFDDPNWCRPFRPARLDLSPEARIWRRPHVVLCPVAGGWRARAIAARTLVTVAVAPLLMIEVTDPHFLVPEWLEWYITDQNWRGALPLDAAGWAQWEVLRPGYKVQVRRLAQNRLAK